MIRYDLACKNGHCFDGWFRDSEAFELTEAGGELYFQAQDGEHGVELWRTSPTAAGAVLVKDINEGEGSSTPGRFTALGDEILFSALDEDHGFELWKSDGTEGGTTLVKEEKLFDPGGRPRDIITGADGCLYIALETGRIVRLVPDES